MATGIQSDTSNARYTTIILLEAEDGTSSIPSESTAGSVTPLSATPTATQFFDLRLVGQVAGALSDDWEIYVHNAAGTDAVACTVRLWAYNITTGKVYPWGVGTGANKGKLNEFNSIDASDTDKVRHWERIPGPGLADGIMAQITASAGTGTETWTVVARCPKNARY